MEAKKEEVVLADKLAKGMADAIGKRRFSRQRIKKKRFRTVHVYGCPVCGADNQKFHKVFKKRVWHPHGMKSKKVINLTCLHCGRFVYDKHVLVREKRVEVKEGEEEYGFEDKHSSVHNRK